MGAFVAARRSASRVVCRSPTRTAEGMPCSAGIVFWSSVVFPLPGALIRLTATTPAASRRARVSSARTWFARNTLLTTSTRLKFFIHRKAFNVDQHDVVAFDELGDRGTARRADVDADLRLI